MKIRKILGIISAFAVTAAFGGCSSTEQHSLPDSFSITNNDPSDADASSEEETSSEPEEPKDIVVSFTALGDNIAHAPNYNQAHERAVANGGDGYDFGYAYAEVEDMFSRKDVTVLNQETLICGDGWKITSYPMFNSPKELGLHMRDIGVDVFTIANNHCLDKGEEGLRDCLNFYDENNLLRVGAYLNKEDRSNIRTIERNGLTISFLSYTESLNGLKLPSGSELEIGMYDMDVILEEVAKAKEISDICVVSLHWGTENRGAQEEYQEIAAKKLAEAGVDVIIGNHPHVLREIEVLDNSDGSQTIVAYSLGNLISAQLESYNLIGGILDFDVVVPADGSGTKIENVEFTPVITHYDWGIKNVRLIKFSDYTPELAKNHGVNDYEPFSYVLIQEYLERRDLVKWIKS